MFTLRNIDIIFTIPDNRVMLRSINCCFFLLFFSTTIVAQADKPVRYRDSYFKNYTLEQNLSYKADGMTDAKKRDYLMDIYLPANDSVQLRPLIIWLHGGGFKFGNKSGRGTPLWAKEFAKKGYVCIAANYRKSKSNPLNNFSALAASCISAMEDLAHLISWSKKHYKEFGIDTTRIILAGNSAGSMVGIQSVYAEMQRLAGMGKRSDSASLRNPMQGVRVMALINFWGGIYDTTWLAHAKVPIVSVHGTKDKIVPFYYDQPTVFGSGIIHRQADRLGISNRLKTYPEKGHELQKPFHPFLSGRKAKRYWREAGNFAAIFLFEVVGIRQ